MRLEGVIFNEKFLLSISLIILGMFFAPYFVLGEDFHVRIHDNLDSNIVWAKMVLDSGGIFGSPDQTIYQIMGGMPRSSVYPLYDIPLVIFDFFGMYWGYLLNRVIMGLVAFFGMYLLLKRYVLDNKDYYLLIAVCVSLFYAMLPYWSFHISVAGLPFVFYCFLNLYNKSKSWTNWVGLIVYGFYSSLVLTGVFLLAFVSLFCLYDCIKQKKINMLLLGGIVLLSASYIISHFPLFYSYFIVEGHVSHRAEMREGEASVNDVLYFINEALFKNPIKYKKHITSMQTYIIMPCVAFALVSMVFRKKINKKMIAIGGVMLIIALLLFSFNCLPGFSDAYSWFFSIIPLKIERLVWFFPLCWFLLFALALEYISTRIQKRNLFLTLFFILIIAQFIFVSKSYEDYVYRHEPTYKQFYAKTQFEDVKNTIGKANSEYKILNINLRPAIIENLHPAVAQYNGFYTLDGYQPDYPLEYKHRFRKIIEKSIEHSPDIAGYFNYWGSRCYALIPDDSEYIDRSNGMVKINKLDFNFDAFHDLGGEYILSEYEIKIENEPRLELVKYFAKADYVDTCWDIYLYKVN